MSSWGATDADEAKPKFLTTAKKSDTYATPKGWVYRDPNTGLEEVLVAIGGLSGKINLADIQLITESFTYRHVRNKGGTLPLYFKSFNW